MSTGEVRRRAGDGVRSVRNKTAGWFVYRATGEIRQQDDLGITPIGGRSLRGGVSVLWRMSSPARVGAICWGQGSHRGPSAARGGSPQAGAAAPCSSWSGYFLSIICIPRWKDKMGEGITYRGSTLGHQNPRCVLAHLRVGSVWGSGCGSLTAAPVLGTALDAQTDTNTGAGHQTDHEAPRGRLPNPHQALSPAPWLPPTPHPLQPLSQAHLSPPISPSFLSPSVFPDLAPSPPLARSPFQLPFPR